ncbi:MAG: YggS family pyridoxal phosphate-dependent enzyme [Pseudomonadota bacterium]|nr:YggS family pyridoxal phosphate-dependent enzyme [Pseudomonadota bacterium]
MQTPPPLCEIPSRIARIKEQIGSIAVNAGRDPEAINLMAVSKYHPSQAVREALSCGHRLFGENRVQEAAQKYPELKATHPELTIHLIGPLQTNKVREAVNLFDVIETLDRPKLAQALAKERDRVGRCPEVFIQINTGQEPQKSGIDPLMADEFIKRVREEFQLPLTGLMCIPPADEEPAMHFALLAECARRHGISKLSMGMSADFDKAICLGATEIRLGTSIFGPRPAR